MKAIVIDSSRETLAATRRLLAAVDPSVEVTEYDSEQFGAPPSAFNWAIYDLLLIARDPGDGRSALDWLQGMASAPGFPATYVLTRSRDETFAAHARRCGAQGVIGPGDLTASRLRKTLRSLATRSSGDETPAEIAHDASILQRIAAFTPLPALENTGYRFQRLIGQGAFSRVYLAEPAGSTELTVLKILDLDQHDHPEVLVAFIREAALLATTRSPHVVRYLAHGCTRSHAWLAMEFLAGGDLKQRIAAGLDLAQTLDLMRQLAAGLAAIHAQGVVHCDLKPGNLMFRGPDELVLVDFGLSRQVRYAHEERDWVRAQGTANYCSPEQLRGETLDAKTDLYSAGVVFFEMLTGHKPYAGQTSQQTTEMHLHAPVPGLPRRLRRFQPVIDSLLSKSPAARYGSAEALMEALRAVG